MKEARNSFEAAVGIRAQELNQKRRQARLIKLFTFGLVDRDKHVIEAEARYKESLDHLQKFDLLISEKELIARDLSDSRELEGARISDKSQPVASVLGGEDYGDGWDSIRHSILERDDWTCQGDDGLCRGPLQVHHRIPLSKGGTNSPANLITLCHFHHSLKHEHMRR